MTELKRQDVERIREPVNSLVLAGWRIVCLINVAVLGFMSWQHQTPAIGFGLLPFLIVLAIQEAAIRLYWKARTVVFTRAKFPAVVCSKNVTWRGAFEKIVATYEWRGRQRKASVYESAEITRRIRVHDEVLVRVMPEGLYVHVPGFIVVEGSPGI